MNSSSQDFRPPKDFEIEEVVTSLDDDERTILKAGNVEEWKRLELTEKKKIRSYITSIVISLWMICTIVGLIRWAIVGDVTLLISSPILLIGPLREILRFYYS